MSLFSAICQRGTRAGQPAATAVVIGALYFVTDELVLERSNGTAWQSIMPGVASIKKTGAAALNGNVTLTGGTNVTLTQVGNDILIAASGSGGSTVIAAGSGSQTAVINTEHTLLSINVAGSYTLHVDKNVMTAGDVLELRIYQIVLTGGTTRVTKVYEFSGVQLADDLVFSSRVFGNELTDTDSLKFTLKQTFGTGRVFPWKVLKY
jgi:Ca2+-binding RTX toxin-like protein